jgi:hypothetical protein
MKYIFLFISIIIIFNSCKKPVGKLSGVVTYYINKEYGCIPDVGSVVSIISKSKIDSAELSILNNYFEFKSKINTINYYSELLKQDSIKIASDIRFLHDYDDQIKTCNEVIHSIWEDFKKKGIQTMSDWWSFDSDMAGLIQRLIFTDRFRELNADGDGAFSTMLPVGEYLVIIQSGHCSGNTKAERDHSFDFRIITIKEDDEATFNKNFYNCFILI